MKKVIFAIFGITLLLSSCEKEDISSINDNVVNINQVKTNPVEYDELHMIRDAETGVLHIWCSPGTFQNCAKEVVIRPERNQVQDEAYKSFLTAIDNNNSSAFFNSTYCNVLFPELPGDILLEFQIRNYEFERQYYNGIEFFLAKNSGISNSSVFYALRIVVE